jgi:hypothetical protein
VVALRLRGCGTHRAAGKMADFANPYRRGNIGPSASLECLNAYGQGERLNCAEIIVAEVAAELLELGRMIDDDPLSGDGVTITAHRLVEASQVDQGPTQDLTGRATLEASVHAPRCCARRSHRQWSVRPGSADRLRSFPTCESSSRLWPG